MLTAPEHEQLRLLLITIEKLEIENPEVLRKEGELWERASLEEKVKLHKEILFDGEDQKKVEQPLLFAPSQTSPPLPGKGKTFTNPFIISPS